MKLGLLVLGLFFATSMAAKAETLYYVGEAITTTGPEVVRHPYCVARTSDLIAGTITENVVSYQNSGYAENSSVMKIENNHFTMTVSSGTVTGVGDLTGAPWKWTFLRGEFKVPSQGMRIVDYNFFADPNSIAGHKDFYIPDGTGGERLVRQEDVLLHLVDQKLFKAKRSELLGR